MGVKGIRKVAVLGGGIMGTGIAQTCAQAGYDVVIREVSRELGEKSLAEIERILRHRLERGSITPEYLRTTMSRIWSTDNMADAVKDADVVFEAVPERLDIKQQVLAETEEFAREDTIFCSNTSSISIAEIASGAKRKANVIGAHFSQPAAVQRLVEVPKTKSNTPEVVDKVVEMLRSLGKEPIVIDDVPGFVTLRGAGYQTEGINLLSEGIATVSSIDKIYRALGHTAGPLEICDFAGLDTVLQIRDYLYSRYRRPELKAPPLLRQMVERGELGRKSGKGFYDYSQPAGQVPPSPVQPPTIKVLAVLSPKPEPEVARLFREGGYTTEVFRPEDGAGLRRAMRDVDFIFFECEEGPFNDLDERRRILAEIEGYCKDEAIFAICSPVRKVADIARDCKVKDRIIGVNFLGSVVDSKVVEMPTPGDTSERVKNVTLDLLQDVGKDPVPVKDVPGFVSRRLELCNIREAILLVQDQVATPEQIDRIMVLVLSKEMMGPLSRADLEGLDAVLRHLDYLYEEYKAPQFEAPALLRRMVREGKLGKKTGEGFFKYSSPTG